MLVYLFFLALLWRYARRHPDTVSMRDALRVLPDLVRLLRRLAADKTVPSGVWVRLVLLLVYLASPITPQGLTLIEQLAGISRTSPHQHSRRCAFAPW
ncbi:MAG: hypothetical protein ABIQ53_13975 [Terracoccus sp.]